MLFLKKFKAVGFKSFANPIELTFKDSMIGVVGPNGSGKSNIVDAIKWVLGEQSKKALRGKSSSDIIFHGSKDKDGSDYALVSLTFDNSNKLLHTDLKEVTVKGEITKDIEYNCIVNLTVDGVMVLNDSIDINESSLNKRLDDWWNVLALFLVM